MTLYAPFKDYSLTTIELLRSCRVSEKIASGYDLIKSRYDKSENHRKNIFG